MVAMGILHYCSASTSNVTITAAGMMNSTSTITVSTSIRSITIAELVLPLFLSTVTIIMRRIPKP